MYMFLSSSSLNSSRYNSQCLRFASCLLFLLSGLCDFFSNCNTQQVHHHIFTSPSVKIQSRTRLNKCESPYIKSSHINWVSKWLGLSFSCHGSTWAGLIHISWVWKRSGIRKNETGLMRVIFLHIFLLLR